MYDNITNYPLVHSFVFGLFGSWGEGKTSVLNLLRNKLHQNDGVIVFDFDPWHFSSEGALIQNFYDGLYYSLNKQFFLPNLRRSLSKYARILTSGLKLSAINIDLGLVSAWGEESLQQLHREIERWLDVIGKKIIVVIDDIDRLQTKAEVHQIFKLVKLLGKFRNTIFVLAFHPPAIQRLFTKDGDPAELEFIDKIVQSPTNLPAVDQSQIDSYLLHSNPDIKHYSGIDQLFKELNIPASRIKDFHDNLLYLYTTNMVKLFPTLRHAKRYLNALYQTLPSVKNEVHLQDFFILEAIRVFYPGVYDDIWKNRHYYIPAWGKEGLFRDPIAWGDDRSKKHESIKKHVTTIIEKQREQDLLMEMLQTIFFIEVKNAFSLGGGANHDNVASAYREEKRLTHPDVFPKYFALKVLSGDISDETVESLISNWNSLPLGDIESRFLGDISEFRKKERLLTLLDRLPVYIHKIRPDVSKSIVSAIYRNIALFSKGGPEIFWQSEYDRSRGLMMLLINEKSQPEEIEPLLVQIIEETPSLEHAVQTVQHCRRERGGNLFNIYDHVNIDNLHQALRRRLSHHFIDEGRNIFQEEPDLYPYILYQWGSHDSDSKAEVSEYVFRIVDADAAYVWNIIKSFVRRYDKPGPTMFQYDDLAKVYNAEKLYEKAKEYTATLSEASKAEDIGLFIRAHEERATLQTKD